MIRFDFLIFNRCLKKGKQTKIDSDFRHRVSKQTSKQQEQESIERNNRIKQRCFLKKRIFSIPQTFFKTWFLQDAIFHRVHCEFQGISISSHFANKQTNKQIHITLTPNRINSIQYQQSIFEFSKILFVWQYSYQHQFVRFETWRTDSVCLAKRSLSERAVTASRNKTAHFWYSNGEIVVVVVVIVDFFVETHFFSNHSTTTTKKRWIFTLRQQKWTSQRSRSSCIGRKRNTKRHMCRLSIESGCSVGGSTRQSWNRWQCLERY